MKTETVLTRVTETLCLADVLVVAVTQSFNGVPLRTGDTAEVAGLSSGRVLLRDTAGNFVVSVEKERLTALCNEGALVKVAPREADAIMEAARALLASVGRCYVDAGGWVYTTDGNGETVDVGRYDARRRAITLDLPPWEAEE